MCSISPEEGQGDGRRKQRKESLWGGKCMAQLSLAAAEGALGVVMGAEPAGAG